MAKKQKKATAPKKKAAAAQPAVNEFAESTPGVYFDFPVQNAADEARKRAEAAAVRAISGGPMVNEFMETTPGVPSDRPFVPSPTVVTSENVTFGTPNQFQETTPGVPFVTPATTARATTAAATAAVPKADDVVLTIAKQKLAEYGLEGIADSLQRARNEYPELEVADLLFIVENDDRYNAPYKTRFKANDLRIKQGLPRLAASEYLKLEQDFARLFTTYNLPMFKNQQQYDKLIAGDVDIADATDRVVMAYDRVLTDTSTRNAFSRFYGSLTDADIVSALLSPEQQIPALERKVVAAEIGGQALRQGLATSLQATPAVTADGRQVTGYSNVQRGTLGAETLAGEGVTEAAAAAGYERIAEQLPAAEKLSAIYGGRAEQVSQRELEQAEILGLESAKRKQRQLAGMEEATFSGQAGTMRTSLGRRGRQGAF